MRAYVPGDMYAINGVVDIYGVLLFSRPSLYSVTCHLLWFGVALRLPLDDLAKTSGAAAFPYLPNHMIYNMIRARLRSRACKHTCSFIHISFSVPSNYHIAMSLM